MKIFLYHWLRIGTQTMAANSSHLRHFVARVCPHVSCYHVPPTGGVWALGTFVWLLTRVRPLVSRKMVRPREDLTTDAARVRLDARMKTHVTG